MAKWSEALIPDLSGKCALVTGAASGIGLHAARALAEHGAEVLLVDKNQAAGAEAVRGLREQKNAARAEFLPLDLSSQQAVKAFTRQLRAQDRPFDLLINNAGIQPISERRTTIDGFELTFGIGHLGHFTLTAGLLPLLLKAQSPRVVTVSSLVHKSGSFDWEDLQIERGYSSQRPYNQTKLANLLFARELQRRATAAGANLLSLAVHPGVARTNIGSNRKDQGQFRITDHVISLVLALVMPLLGQPAQAGAWPTLYAATAADVVPGGFYGPDGFGEMKGAPALARVAARGMNDVTARRLWEVSEQLTGEVFSFA